MFKFAVRKTEEIARRMLERNGLDAGRSRSVRLAPGEPPHHPVGHREARRRPDKVIINIERFGNTTAATIPLALNDAVCSGRLKKGDLVLLASVGAGFHGRRGAAALGLLRACSRMNSNHAFHSLNLILILNHVMTRPASFCSRPRTAAAARRAGAVAESTSDVAQRSVRATARRSATCSRSSAALYFRGKLTYARRFAAPPDVDNPIVGSGVHVITPNAGLRSPDTRVTRAAIRHSPRTTSIPTTRLPAAARAERDGAATRNRRLRRRAARQHRVAEVRRRAARDLRRAPALSDRLRRPRRHEPRRPAAAAGRRRRRAGVRAGRRRRAARPAAAEARSAMPRSRADDSPRPGQRRCCAVGKREVRLTNLRKIFWPELGLTKGDLLQYYATSPTCCCRTSRSRDGDEALSARRRRRVLLHEARAEPAAGLDRICAIDHGNGNIIDFPMIDDLPSLLWVINLGCIDLNQWYARCDDVDRPDYLHFDLDPGSGATFERVRETGLVVREALDTLKMPSLVKTTGSKGLHVYVPIVRGPVQKEVWTFAKALAQELAARIPTLITAEYRVAKRPRGRVLVDYNQNAWGRTLASIYSVRPRPEATVSTPVTWKEVETRHPHRGLHREERARARREDRRSLEAAARRARPFRPRPVPLTACSFATSISICRPS